MDDDGDEVGRAIRALHKEFARLVNERRIDELVRLFYVEDARALPPNRPMVQGRDPIAELNRTAPDDQVHAELHSVWLDHQGDLACHIGRYELTVQPAGGAERRDMGKTLEVYRRQPDGSWKCVADIWNSDLPAS